MLQAVTEGVGVVRVHDAAALPHPDLHQVIIRVERVGICGSDVHVFDGSHPYLGYPIVQGHEVVGILDRLGAHVDGLKVGDRVVVEPTVACGTCGSCRRGRPNCCVNLRVIGITLPGGLAQELAVDAPNVHAVGDLDPDAAVAVEPIAVAIRCLERAEVGPGSVVLVLGGGSIGRSVALAAQARGARPVVADRAPERRALAASLGAATVDLSRRRLAGAIATLAGADGCPAVIDTTGSGRWLRLALELVAYSGTVVAAGISEDDLSVPVALLSRKEVSLHGSRNSIGAFPEAIDLARSHQEVLKSSVSHRFALCDAEHAIRAVASREATGKVIVDMSIQGSQECR